MLVELIISKIFSSILTWHLEHQLRACEKKSIDGRLVVIRHHPGSEQLYTRISAAQVRRQLIEQKGYGDEDLPTAEVIRQQLNQMGDRQLRVAKTKPQKTIAETEAIFAKVNRVNAAPTEINFII